MDQGVTNQWLCEGVRQGRSSAEHLFYQSFKEIAQREAFRLLRHREDSEDVAHDSLLRVLCRLRDQGIDVPEKLDGFVSRTAKYMAIAHLRRHSVSKTRNLGNAEDVLTEGADGYAHRYSAEVDMRLNGLVERLGRERDRQVLQGLYLRELPKDGLCHQFGLRPDQLNRVAHRARQRLRQLVEQCVPELAEEMV